MAITTIELEGNRERKIRITGPIGDDEISKIWEWIDGIDDNTETICIDISSDGGNANESLVIYETLRMISDLMNIHVVTTNIGKCYSAAAIIFMAGDRRIIYKSSGIMFHTARFRLDDMTIFTQTTLRSEEKQINALNNAVQEILEDRLPSTTIGNDVRSDNDYIFYSDEMLQYGIATDSMWDVMSEGQEGEETSEIFEDFGDIVFNLESDALKEEGDQD